MHHFGFLRFHGSNGFVQDAQSACVVVEILKGTVIPKTVGISACKSWKTDGSYGGRHLALRNAGSAPRGTPILRRSQLHTLGLWTLADTGCSAHTITKYENVTT